MNLSNKREEFINELQLLLEEFDCYITAEDHWQGYPECGQDVRMTVEFEDWEVGEINLGTHIDKETPWTEILKEQV